MLTGDPIGILLFGGVAFLAGLAALFLTAWLDPVSRRRARSQLLRSSDDGETVFLFEQERLVDATHTARQLLEAAPRSGTHWARLIGLLAPQFANAAALAELEKKGEVSLTSADGGTRLAARSVGAMRRVSLINLEEHGARVQVDRHSLAAMRSELDTLRANTDTAPFLVWRESADGQITWVNKAYLDMVEKAFDIATARAWPPPALFESASELGPSDRKSLRRLCLRAPGLATERWFDCHMAPLGDEMLLTAIDADAAVVAETQLREFMQTLTKTFAHLTVGLVIFDRSRRLALFNPALTDLTGLPVDFLTGRPTLLAFLDRLRERQMMPEPKDYRTWRKEIAELEAAAADGKYSETWSLGTGQTYRVTGRPHPDGAIAFLFEDISAEISLTRRFRAELEMGQATIDALEDGVAVFSGDGVLALANAAYCSLWDSEPNETLNDISIVEATRTWIDKSAPSPLWGDLREFVLRPHQRAEWSAPVRLLDGRAVDCRVVPIAGGATMVQFTLRRSAPQPSEIRKRA